MKTPQNKKKQKGKSPTRLYNDGRIRRKLNPVLCDAACASFGAKGIKLYSSVSQPPGRGPVPGPGVNYTGPREVLLEFVILVF